MQAISHFPDKKKSSSLVRNLESTLNTYTRYCDIDEYILVGITSCSHLIYISYKKTKGCFKQNKQKKKYLCGTEDL